MMEDEDDELYHYDDEDDHDMNVDAAVSPQLKPSSSSSSFSNNTSHHSDDTHHSHHQNNNNNKPKRNDDDSTNIYPTNGTTTRITTSPMMNEALPSSPPNRSSSSGEDVGSVCRKREIIMRGEQQRNDNDDEGTTFIPNIVYEKEQAQLDPQYSSSQRNYIDDDDILFENQEKQLQTQKYLTIVPYEIAYHEGQLLTCVRVNRLPILVNKLVEEVNQYLQQESATAHEEESTEENEENVVDVYAIQTLFLNCIMRIDKFNNESEVYQHVRKRVFDNLQNVMSPPDYYPFNYPTFYGEDHDIEQIESYNKLMESDEMKESRKSYQTKYTAQWTKQERKKFNEGLKLFGYGHDSNKKIAEYMGSHIHPNQVAHEKQRLQLSHQKKRKKTKK
nr:unnamed protein product [Naegleria fowleri]